MKKTLLFILLTWTAVAFSQDGTLDNTFTIGTGANERINMIQQLQNGKILIGGAFTAYNGHPVKTIARLNSDGTLDESFVADYEGNYVTDFYVETDGKIVVAGSEYPLVRLHENGALDEEFDTDFTGYPAKVVKQGYKYIVSGAVSQNGDVPNVDYRGVIRLNYDGSIDTTFSPTYPLMVGDWYTKAKVVEDDKIMVYGNFTSPFGNAIMRLNPNGSVDDSFDSGEGADSNIYDIILLSDGNYVITGAFIAYDNVQRLHLAKINSDGSLNEDVQATPGYVILGNTIKELPDGRILLGGWDNTNNPGDTEVYLVRLESDGTLDMTFNMDAFNNHVASIDVQDDGKILVGGLFTDYDGQPQKRIARLKNTIMSADEHNIDVIKAYPNPVTTILNFEDVQDNTAFAVYNILGSKVYNGFFTEISAIDMSSLTNGIYIVKVQSGDKVFTQKVIKQ